MQSQLSLTLQQIVDQLGGSVSNGKNVSINRVGSLALAQTGAIGFFSDTKYTSQLNSTQASAIIISPQHASLTQLPCIIIDNPYAYFAKVSSLLNPVFVPVSGVAS